MDKADIAQQIIDYLTEEAISQVLRNKEESLRFRGYCHYCYEPVAHPQRFCDLDCRSDWDKEDRMRRINGID